MRVGRVAEQEHVKSLARPQQGELRLTHFSNSVLNKNREIDVMVFTPDTESENDFHCGSTLQMKHGDAFVVLNSMSADDQCDNLEIIWILHYRSKKVVGFSTSWIMNWSVPAAQQ